MHRNTTTVTDALIAAGAAGRPIELSTSARTAAEAAESLGVPIGAIANSLIFLADGEAILVLTSGAHRVDTMHLAGIIGVESIGRASAEAVREATGQPIGGVAPVGHPNRVPTYIDAALSAYPIVWAAAGTPHTVFPTTFEELIRITDALTVTVE
jgi:prolyl-tRNA editing enzyme YbaK/EbsC (Cys-tRNA(Pro) deacylase)